MSQPADIVVAGHICLDLIPTFAAGGSGEFRPGALYNVGPAVQSTGGAVANTGLALHRLGIDAALMGKVGDDLFGGAILQLLAAQGERLPRGMKISPGETTSYTVVLSPPGVDRTFIHCPGCNDSFGADDLNDAVVASARLLHFGYPTLMRRMYQDRGSELAALMGRGKRLGVTTSLDMTSVDPSSDAGKIDWTALLSAVLPHVDCFVPSVEELLFMLDRPAWDRLMGAGGIEPGRDLTVPMVRSLADRLLAMGCAVVMLKLGDQGAYLKTTASARRLGAMGRCAPTDIDAWVGHEALEPCFEVNVAGTTGSGDCTIAGFLAGLLHQAAPRQALRQAVAVGACSVERPDATSGVPPLSEVRRRLDVHWPRLGSRLSL